MVELFTWNLEENPYTALPANWEIAEGGTPDARLHLVSEEIHDGKLPSPGMPIELIARSVVELEWKLYRFLIRRLRTLTMLHCGGVKIGKRVLLFPGASGVGKSTLVRELCEAGAGYLTDEWVFVDDEGDLHYYPRALKLKDPSRRESRIFAEPGPQDRCEIWFTAYRKREEPWVPMPQSSTLGCLELLKNCPQVRRYPEQAMTRLSTLSRKAKFWTTARPDAKWTALELHRFYSSREKGQLDASTSTS